MMRPKVSILIPVFNRRQFIAECIQSALDQTIDDIEIVIVDNASDDGTWEICQRFSLDDARVRAFRNDTNIGPLKNILSGIGKCEGKFIKILFSDDVILSDCLEKMVAALEETPKGGMVVTNVSPLRNGRISEIPLYSIKTGQITSEQYIKSVIFDDAMPLSPGACLFRREDIRNNYRGVLKSPIDRRVEDHGAGPDLLSMLLTAACYDYVCLIDEPLNIFREHEGSLSISKSGISLSDCYVQAKVNFAIDYFSRRELYDILARIYVHRCLGYKMAIMPWTFRNLFGINLNFIGALQFNIFTIQFILKKFSGRFRLQ